MLSKNIWVKDFLSLHHRHQQHHILQWPVAAARLKYKPAAENSQSGVYILSMLFAIQRCKEIVFQVSPVLLNFGLFLVKGHLHYLSRDSPIALRRPY
jgi:hypothetical protein